MRTNSALPAFAACLLALAPWFATAQEDAVEEHLILEETPAAEPAPDRTPKLTETDAEAWLDGFLPAALEAGDIVGAVIVVVKDGQVLLQKGYGYSDLEQRRPVDPETTLFRPGSISKLFTWTAVMQLVEAGRIDLDADVNQYLDFVIPAQDGKPLTMRQIMTHTGGFEDTMRGLIFSDPDALTSLGESLKRWVPARIHTPGTTPAYSNYATALAGYIVERVSGDTFDDYVERHLFVPLGMTRASFRQPLPDAIAGNMSEGYASLSEGTAKPYELINFTAAGSLAASGADIARFMLAHLNAGEFQRVRILSEATTQAMHRTTTPSVGPLHGMMLGFYDNSLNGHFSIAHAGDTRWFHSDLRLFPDDGAGYFISMNSAGAGGAPWRIRQQLAIGFVQRYLPGDFPSSPGIDAEEARAQAMQVAGIYESSWRAQTSVMGALRLLRQVEVIAKPDGGLQVAHSNAASGAPRQWAPMAPWLWQDPGTGERLAVEITNGEVVRFAMEPSAPIMVFERLPEWHRHVPMLARASLAVVLLTFLAWPVSAMVRHHYRVRYPLSGVDARAHGTGRWASLLTGLGACGGIALVMKLANDTETLAGMDGFIIAARLGIGLALVAGAVLALRSFWNTVRSRKRQLLAKIWSLALALACLVLLLIGFAYRLVGISANF